MCIHNIVSIGAFSASSDGFSWCGCARARPAVIAITNALFQLNKAILSK